MYGDIGRYDVYVTWLNEIGNQTTHRIQFRKRDREIQNLRQGAKNTEKRDLYTKKIYLKLNKYHESQQQ